MKQYIKLFLMSLCLTFSMTACTDYLDKAPESDMPLRTGRTSRDSRKNCIIVFLISPTVIGIIHLTGVRMRFSISDAIISSVQKWIRVTSGAGSVNLTAGSAAGWIILMEECLV